MSSYTYSVMVKEAVPVLVRRPWWKVFGRDSIGSRDAWICKTVVLNEAEVRLVLKDKNALRILQKALGGIQIFATIEKEHETTPYIRAGEG